MYISTWLEDMEKTGKLVLVLHRERQGTGWKRNVLVGCKENKITVVLMGHWRGYKCVQEVCETWLTSAEHPALLDPVWKKLDCSLHRSFPTSTLFKLTFLDQKCWVL